MRRNNYNFSIIRIKNHFQTFEKLFVKGTKCKLKDIHNLVNAMLSDSKMTFKKIEYYDSSFTAFVPNSKKLWDKNGDNNYVFNRKGMSTINSREDRSQTHRKGMLTSFAQDRCVQGLTRAGITPQRMHEAVSELSVKEKNKIKLRA